MKTTARILLVGLSAAGTWQAPCATAAPIHAPATWLKSTVLRQADTEEPDDQETARDLISRARQAMKEGHLDVADELITEAEALDVRYSPLYFGDTPKRARKELTRLARKKQGGGGLADRFRFFGKDDEQVEEVVDPFAVSAEKQARLQTPAETQPLPMDTAPADTRGLEQPPERTQPGDERSASDELLKGARKAIAYGDLNRARKLIDQAVAMEVEYSLGEDSPAKVNATWKRVQALTVSDPGSRQTEAYRREYAAALVEQAEAMLQWGELDEAERLCGVAGKQNVNYGPFDVKPQAMLERIAAARLGKSPATPSQTEPPKLQQIDAATVAGGNPAKLQVAGLLKQSREALSAGELEQAEQLAREAEAIRLPDNAYVNGDDRPWVALLDIQKARMVRSRAVPATSETSDTSPPTAAPAVYDSSLDATRNVPAQATTPFDEAATSEPGVLPPTDPMGSALPTPGEGPGYALFRQGEDSLRKRDVPAATEFFRQAAAHRDEFDPLTWQRLQDHLQLLGPPANNNRGADAAAQDPAAQAQLAARQVAAELARLETESRRLTETDPRRAREVLVTAGQMVESAGLEPVFREQLLRRVQRATTELDQYVANNQGRIELLDQNREIKGQIEREQKMQVEVQQKLAKLVDNFNHLMEERRYPEAELVAKQAQELAPEEPVVVQLRYQVRQMRHLMQELELRGLKEEGALTSWTNVEASMVPFDDGKTVVWGDAKEWIDMTQRRESLQPGRRSRSEKEIEIEKKLTTPVSLSFRNRPLAEVIDYLGKVAQVNTYLNLQALADAGVTPETSVTIDLQGEISLKSALNIILEELNLTYVIKNEVLTITSEDEKDGSLYTVTYYVADLVIAIPNFVPNSRMGLAGALHDAHGTLGYGGIGGFGGHAPISVVANRDGSSSSADINPAILAAFGPETGLPTGASPVAPSSAGPGGIGGGVQPDFDSLIELIESTIAPTTWTNVGGTGAIQEYENNLTLVISQTQEVHEEIADLLEQLRRLQDLQVTIEVRFITLADSFFERIGVDMDIDLDDDIDAPFQVFGRGNGDEDGVGGPETRDTRDQDHGPTVTVGLDPTGNFTSDLDIPFQQGSFGLATPQFGGFSPGAGATMGFAILSDIEARFLIEASQGDRRTNILQAPKVTLFNGQQAFVNDTSQSPFVISLIPVVGDFAAAQQPVIVVLNEGTHLSVQAVVSSDRRFVRLTVVPFFSQIGDVDTFTFQGSTTTTTDTASEGPDDDTTSRANSSTTTSEGTTVQLPTFSFTSVTTTVSVPDGGTVLLGGIKRMSEGRNEFGVPLISKVPYLNRLFRNVGIGHETTSLMMMVTPRIIIQEEEEALLGVPQPGAPAQP